ncbi:MAG: hypothetical protein AB1442_10410 [Nitrospirota bacterium]
MAHSKSIRKKLHELKVEAHEREIKKHLIELSKMFEDWKKDEMSSGELSMHIHEYDKGPSKWMMGFYNGIDYEVSIARAVAIGLLARDEVSDEILETIERQITYFKEQNKKPKRK